MEIKWFRQSKMSIIIDLLLLPFLIVRAIYLDGVPATVDEIIELPSVVKRDWLSSYWKWW